MISGNTNYVENDEAVLECAVTTYPQPNIVWVKREENKGTVVLHSQRTSLSFSYFREHVDGPRAVSRVTISSLSTSDTGTYSCHVYTDIPGYLTASSCLTITVQGTNDYSLPCVCGGGGGCLGFPSLKLMFSTLSFADSAIHFVLLSHLNGIKSTTKFFHSI